MKKAQILSVIAIFCLFPQNAFAAGAYIVDDAGIVDPGMVQIESWYNHSTRNNNIGTIDAAYQVFPHAEFTLLNAYTAQTGGTNDALSAQIKYQWRESNDDRDIASSAVFGVVQSASDDHFSDLYIYIPSTWEINEAVAVNANLGWQYTAVTERHFLTWGIGTEIHANNWLSFVGEFFGDSTWKPGTQFGIHTTLSDQFSFDLIYGRDITGVNANWITAGLTTTF